MNRSNEQSKRDRCEDFNQQQQSNRYSPNGNSTSQSRNLKIVSPNHGTAAKTKKAAKKSYSIQIDQLKITVGCNLPCFSRYTKTWKYPS